MIELHGISAGDPSGPTSGTQRGGTVNRPTAAGLRVGETIIGRVLSSSDGRALVRFSNFDILVTSQEPLMEGEKVAFRVMGLQPEIILQFSGRSGDEGGLSAALSRYLAVEGSESAILDLINTIKGSAPAGKGLSLDPALLGELRSLMELLVFDGTRRGDADFIRRLLFHSGLFFESKLRDLLRKGAGVSAATRVVREDMKALLIRMAAVSADRMTDPEGRNLEVMRDLLEQLTAAQVKMAVRTNGGHELTLFVPMAWPWEEGAVNVRMFWERDGRGKGEDRLSFTIHLDMTTEAIGSLEFDLILRGKNLSYRFLMERGNAVRAAELRLLQLDERLTALGFTVDGSFCSLLKEGDAGESGKGVQLGPEGIVDLKI